MFVLTAINSLCKVFLITIQLLAGDLAVNVFFSATATSIRHRKKLVSVPLLNEVVFVTSFPNFFKHWKGVNIQSFQLDGGEII